MVERWDVVVIGGGHAGCEAALAAARMGRRTLLLTGDLNAIARLSCNPSMGGPAKGHLVREIAALGGAMAHVTDRTAVQVRLLNSGKGPAVQALRAQLDKDLYPATMRDVLAAQAGLELRAAMVTGLLLDADPETPAGGRVAGVITANGERVVARSVVVTTGTFLNGRMIAGERITPGGRVGEAPAEGLSAQFAAAGLRLGRLKTGTPPRIEARSIDFGRTQVQPGSRVPLWFSFEPPPARTWRVQPPAPWFPEVVTDGWRVQMPCYLVRTNGATHAAIRANLHRAPMFNGLIEGAGPRYCPSIEDKIVRFAQKDAHPLFLEPEGFTTSSVYVQGANTSLPEDVQDAMLRTIPALAAVKVLRFGYAVEYDFVPPDQTTSWLECKRLPGLFLAGQINGTSGYEEAAGQGLIAGINAALAAGRPTGSGTAPTNGAAASGAAAAVETTTSTAATFDRLAASNRLVLPRDLAYIGVMIDDLTTTEHREPYRLHTARAEYRLLLRQDTAHFRLTPIGYRLGLIGREVHERTERQRDQVATVLQQVRGKGLGASPELNARLQAAGLPPVTKSTMALAYLRRPEVGAVALAALGWDDLPSEIADHVLTEIKYEGFIARQAQAVARSRQLEHHRIPDRVDYQVLRGLRTEAQEQLGRFRPATIGQAARIAGVTPADISVLLVRLHAS